MHHARDVVLREHARQCRLVEEVADYERCAGEAAMAGREVVVDDRTKARRGERAAGMRADIAGTAGNQNDWAIAHAHLYCLSMISARKRVPRLSRGKTGIHFSGSCFNLTLRLIGVG